jgi:RNA polymerase sigma-70 factor, ECF subfamily
VASAAVRTDLTNAAQESCLSIEGGGRRREPSPVQPIGSSATLVAEESELVRRVQAGDSAAFDSLVRRYIRRAYTVAYRLLGHREDAEDLVQETFMIVLRQIDDFQLGRPFGPWMYRILTNRGLNARKARALRRTEHLPDDLSVADAPDLALERAEVRARFRSALDTLPPRQRLVMELIELDGFTRGEVAGMLEISEATVRWHVHDAWRTLRRILQPLAVR